MPRINGDIKLRLRVQGNGFDEVAECALGLIANEITGGGKFRIPGWKGKVIGEITVQALEGSELTMVEVIE